jgi:hypothetical protein
VQGKADLDRRALARERSLLRTQLDKAHEVERAWIHGHHAVEVYNMHVRLFFWGGDVDKCLPGPMRTCCLATQAAMQRQVHDKRRALMESDHQRALKQLPRDQKLARERSLKAYKRVRELRAQVCPRHLTCREL